MCFGGLQSPAQWDFYKVHSFQFNNAPDHCDILEFIRSIHNVCIYMCVCVYTMSHLYNEKTIWLRRWEQQLVIPRSDRDPISQNMEVNSPWSSPQSTPDQEEETPKKKAQNVLEMTEMTGSFHVEIRGWLIYIYIYIFFKLIYLLIDWLNYLFIYLYIYLFSYY